MGRYEVAQAQWLARMGSNPSRSQSATAEVPASQVPQRPVDSRSWNTIEVFLSQTGIRLPMEAEWEYAYRASTTTAFHGYTGQESGTNNESLLGNIAWFNSSSNSQTRPARDNALRDRATTNRIHRFKRKPSAHPAGGSRPPRSALSRRSRPRQCGWPDSSRLRLESNCGTPLITVVKGRRPVMILRLVLRGLAAVCLKDPQSALQRRGCPW